MGVCKQLHNDLIICNLNPGIYDILRSYLSALNINHSRSQWPRGLKRGSAAACLLGLRVRISSGASMPVSCEC